jgi:hypothetical protein
MDITHFVYPVIRFEAHMGYFHLSAIIRAAMNTCVQVFVWTCFHFSGSHTVAMLNDLRYCQTSFQGVHFTFPPVMDGGVQFLLI